MKTEKEITDLLKEVKNLRKYRIDTDMYYAGVMNGLMWVLELPPFKDKKPR
jgi:hypothetical protein